MIFRRTERSTFFTGVESSRKQKKEKKLDSLKKKGKKHTKAKNYLKNSTPRIVKLLNSDLVNIPQSRIMVKGIPKENKLSENEQHKILTAFMNVCKPSLCNEDENMDALGLIFEEEENMRVEEIIGDLKESFNDLTIRE
ncbi:hypothetical protein WA026_014308 [Henosepilachna vigintioctopunctata]|uniref:Uncharacterized protein n=1 Tax=Henosepilachna vigintioctopunctata TaxID=420089 RepID=A0AAW1TUP0_9CUCU